MPRDMTLAEKNRFVGWFPNLNADLQPRVTAEATQAYNCIAWTLGITNEWFNPLQSLDLWDDFYAPYHYVRADQGQIAIWRSGQNFTHGSVQHIAHGFNWESKCGSSLRIMHEQAELVGDSYGVVVAYYELTPPSTATASVVRATPATPPSAMTEQQKAVALHNLVKDIDPALQQEFNDQFEAWKKTWFEGAMALSSNIRDRANTYSYRNLVAMGSEIIPLVMVKIANPENFVAKQLLHDLQPDSPTRAALVPLHVGEGEHAHARRVLEAFLQSRR